ncbi:hypothetical protein Pyn_31463 [Prunus yedoensis var. nudiflora]|uniref:Uncharacterized protein n=1 Tax=Prunus yedoensis var. nudiflora TaxID=2094558 RepID=A0A314ZII5_PRUYE|nr:hypothetical protein Pyn_31463 [Prunus yedoensis var. nudiflora]
MVHCGQLGIVRLEEKKMQEPTTSGDREGKTRIWRIRGEVGKVRWKHNRCAKEWPGIKTQHVGHLEPAEDMAKSVCMRWCVRVACPNLNLSDRMGATRQANSTVQPEPTVQPDQWGRGKGVSAQRQCASRIRCAET